MTYNSVKDDKIECKLTVRINGHTIFFEGTFEELPSKEMILNLSNRYDAQLKKSMAKP